MEERGWRRLRWLLSHFFLHFLVILFLLSLCSPLPHSYMPHYKSISGISPVPFPRPMHTRKIYRRGRDGVFLYTTQSKSEERERVQRMGAGGKLTQASGVVKCLRIGSTDCVELTLSTSLTRTHAQTFPWGCFGFLDVYGLQPCIYVRVSCPF